MPVNRSTKYASNAAVQRLPAIIDEAAHSKPALGPTALLAEVRRLGVHTPDEATAVLRTDRERH